MTTSPFATKMRSRHVIAALVVRQRGARWVLIDLPEGRIFLIVRHKDAVHIVVAELAERFDRVGARHQDDMQLSRIMPAPAHGRRRFQAAPTFTTRPCL